MADINIFVTDPSEERLSVLKEYAKQIGCITLPYGVCPDGLELPQAIMVSTDTLPRDFTQRHPNACAVFSSTPLSCTLPNIQCNSTGTYICLCLPPPDSKCFSPSGLTEEWVNAAEETLKGRDPDTVTVELCAGAYDVPFPYDGTFSTCSVSEALFKAKQYNSVLRTNKYSYYSYFIYSENGCPHVVFVSNPNRLKDLIKRFSSLGIKRFAGADTEFFDAEMRPLLSFFKNLP